MNEFISALLGFAGGGGLLSIFLIRQKLKTAKIENSKEIIKLYKDYVADFRTFLCYDKGCQTRIKPEDIEEIVKQKIDED